MDPRERLLALSGKAEKELEKVILPYWYQSMDRLNGGFFGLVRDDGSVDPGHPKGLVMHARHLWAYSSAWMVYRDPLYLAAAHHAFDFLAGALRDEAQGGFFWTVEASGKVDPGASGEAKLLYGQAFAVYGLARFHRATGNRQALDLALETYGLMEGRGLDRREGGYFEAVSADWSRPEKVALSEVDLPCAKSMNTNLHVLEAYTELCLATGRLEVRDSLEKLLDVFERRVLVTPEHLGIYFDEAWRPFAGHESFGHDIEASWLMTEAAEALGESGLDQTRIGRYLAIAGPVRDLVLEHGALPNEREGERLDTTRIWWVEAEALVGMVNAWELSPDEAYLDAAELLWDWIDTRQADRERGEWFWAVDADGRPDRSKPKGGLWKTSYHNGRACMEIIRRARKERA